MEDKNIISKEKESELQAELREILDVKWPKITQQLKEAREQGDLSENADYDAAKNEQAALKKRLDEINSILNNYVVLDEKNLSKEEVGFNSTVEYIKYVDGEEPTKKIVKIVGELDIDPLESKFSNNSPLGKVLFSKKVGYEGVVVVDNGQDYKIKITKIF